MITIPNFLIKVHWYTNIINQYYVIKYYYFAREFLHPILHQKEYYTYTLSCDVVLDAKILAQTYTVIVLTNF